MARIASVNGRQFPTRRCDSRERALNDRQGTSGGAPTLKPDTDSALIVDDFQCDVRSEIGFSRGPTMARIHERNDALDQRWIRHDQRFTRRGGRSLT
jgi:hypothetical protein